MLSFGFVSAAPPVKSGGVVPLPGAPTETGASDDMAAFDAALASTLAVIEQEAQRVETPAAEEPSGPVDWLLAPLFALPADASLPDVPAAVLPDAAAAENAGLDALVADAIRVDAAHVEGAAVTVTVAAAAQQATLPTAGMTKGSAAGATTPPAPQAPQRGANAPSTAQNIVSAGAAARNPADSGAAVNSAPVEAPAVVEARQTADAPQLADAAQSADAPRGSESKPAPAMANGAERRNVSRPAQHAPVAPAGITPSNAAPAADAPVAQRAPIEPPATAVGSSATGKTQDAAVGEPKTTPAAPRAEAAAAATPQFAATTSPASTVVGEAARSTERQAALAAVQPLATPAASAKNEAPAADAQIRTGAAIEQAGGSDAAAGGDAGTSQGHGRPSQEFMRFAAALAQAAPPEANRAEPIVRSAETAPTAAVAPAAAASAPIAPAAAATAAVSAPPPSADAENVGRLVQAMRITARQGGWEATVRLNPDHLGEVTIALRVDRNAVSAVVNAEAPGVRQWLESQEQSVRSGMAEHGLQLERFVVQRDGQRKDPQPQQQDGRRQPQKRHDAAARFEVIV